MGLRQTRMAPAGAGADEGSIIQVTAHFLGAPISHRIPPMAAPTPQIFDSAPVFGGSYSIDDTTLSFNTGGQADPSLGQLVQSIQVGYGREVARHYELGSKNTYYLVGRAAGTASIKRISSLVGINTSFLIAFSSICNLSSRSITIGGSQTPICGPQPTTNYVLTSPLITELGIVFAIGAVSMTEDVNLQFIGLQLANGSTPATSAVGSVIGAVGS